MAACRDVIRTRGVVWIILVIAIVDALGSVSGPRGPAVIASSVAWALIAGYLLGFSREVAYGQQCLPPPSAVTDHLRRGVSLYVVELPGLVASLPVVILGGTLLVIPYRLEVLSRSTFFGVLGLIFSVAVTVATLPFLGPYVIEDRIAAAFRLKTHVRTAWLNIGLLAPPFAFALISSTVILALRPVLFWLTRAPVFLFASDVQRPTALVTLGDRPVFAALALFGFGVLSAFIEVVAAQLVGWYARELKSLRVPV